MISFWQTPKLKPEYMLITFLGVLAICSLIHATKLGDHLDEDYISINGDCADAVVRCGHKIVTFIGEFIKHSPDLDLSQLTPQYLCAITHDGRHPAVGGDLLWKPVG